MESTAASESEHLRRQPAPLRRALVAVCCAVCVMRGARCVLCAVRGSCYARCAVREPMRKMRGAWCAVRVMRGARIGARCGARCGAVRGAVRATPTVDHRKSMDFEESAEKTCLVPCGRGPPRARGVRRREQRVDPLDRSQ